MKQQPFCADLTCLTLFCCRQLKYETGDHVGIHARNSEKTVAQAAALLGLSLDTMFKLHADGKGARCVWLGECTVEFSLLSPALLT